MKVEDKRIMYGVKKLLEMLMDEKLLRWYNHDGSTTEDRTIKISGSVAEGLRRKRYD